MPAAQVINLNAPAGGPTPLERTAESFTQRFMENKERQRESDALKEIYGKYQNDEKMMEKSMMDIQTSTELSPTTKVNASNQLLNIQKYNQQLQKEVLKKLEKEDKKKAVEDKEEKKRKHEEELDKNEMQYLQSIKGKKMSPLEIYEGAGAAGLPRESRNRLATFSRLQNREARLTEKDISNQYNFELKELDRKIKELNSEKDKKPLRKEREDLINQRKSDLDRYKKGDRDFNLAMYGEEAVAAGEIAQDVNEDIIEEQIDPFIQILDKNLPASSVAAGTVKWLPAEKSPDGKKHSYKSDGKKWVQVR